MTFQNSQLIIETPDHWRFVGELSFNTVGALLIESTRQQLKPQILDLLEVTRTDSAGLALLIELRKQMDTLIFQNIPAQMLTLATVNGVQDLLTPTALGN